MTTKLKTKLCTEGVIDTPLEDKVEDHKKEDFNPLKQEK